MWSMTPHPVYAPSQPAPFRGLSLVPDLESPTGEFHAAEGVVVPAIEAIDHRTRLRVIHRPLARRGPHLALDLEDDQLLPLRDRISHVGRGTLAQIRVDDQRVSRDHAILVVHGEDVRLLDNRSSTGTFVNGRVISATTLADGDVIQLGPIELRYLWIDPPR